jgi:predicted dithiol-disulfide oxidoreductase (DUF899 family)
MTSRNVGTRDEWLAARLQLLEAEKKHTRRGDGLTKMRQELPWVHTSPRKNRPRFIALTERLHQTIPPWCS